MLRKLALGSSTIALFFSFFFPASPAVASISCPAGTSVSSTDSTKCVATLQTATATTTQIKTCVSPAVLVGDNCVTSGRTYPATVSAGYTTCPNGGTVSGYVCILPDVWHDGYWTSPVTISANTGTNYSCSSGGYLSGSNCVVTTSTSITTTTNYYCSNSSYPNLSGSTCWNTYYSSNTPAASTTSYSCPSGYSNISNSTCQTTSTYLASSSTYYYCSSGYISGSSCVLQDSQWVAGYYTSGGSYNGTWVSGGSTCPNGGVLSGSDCVIADIISVPTISYSGTCPAFYQLDTFTGVCKAYAFDPATIVISDIYTCVTTYQDGSTLTRSYYYDATLLTNTVKRVCSLGTISQNPTSQSGLYLCNSFDANTSESISYISAIDETSRANNIYTYCTFQQDVNLVDTPVTSSIVSTDITCDAINDYKTYLSCLYSVV